ncbi:hypothetical protein [Mesorhizobium sp. SP-1A]|uniref:hypothetical protein n=1 Tax=Mesorhizobium sp. SP-1A TaxID=3077840 RepID=UPI0028F6FC5F|nr:hypothetical protein [Mesorhizobium sp. SP-1A]
MSILKTQRCCVFCGEKPKDKNREHVIPRWLMDITGGRKKPFDVQMEPKAGEKIKSKIATDKFVSPSCTECNSIYAALENEAKAAMAVLLNQTTLTGKQANSLLDWFDKVRIGLFINNMMLNKGGYITDPHFFIDQRIAAKDRCLLIYKLDEAKDTKGIAIISTNDHSFYDSPTSFILIVNDLLFINISSDFLFSERMGFPYPTSPEIADGKFMADEFSAKFRLFETISRLKYHRPNIELFQSIVDLKIVSAEHNSMLNNKYILDNSLQMNPLRSKVCAKIGSRYRFIDDGGVIPFGLVPKNKSKDMISHAIRLYEIKNQLLKSLYDTYPSGHDFLNRNILYNSRQLVVWNTYKLASTFVKKKT